MSNSRTKDKELSRQIDNLRKMNEDCEQVSGFGWQTTLVGVVVTVALVAILCVLVAQVLSPEHIQYTEKTTSVIL